MTVDYALEPENVDRVYETSRGMGFVPFVSNRALDRYVEPVPQPWSRQVGGVAVIRTQFGSPGRIRTYNLAVNSRPLYR